MTCQQDRDSAILECRAILSQPFVVLDTETTGKFDAQVCQIGIVNQDGLVVMETLVKPNRPIEAGAIRVHGITNTMVDDAPSFSDVAGELKKTLGLSPVVIYNAPFDIGALHNSARACGVKLRFTNHAPCAMRIYAKFNGAPSTLGGYRWWKLGEACAMCGIKPVGNLHGAAVDAEMTRRLVVFMAGQKLSTEG